MGKASGGLASFLVLLIHFRTGCLYAFHIIFTAYLSLKRDVGLDEIARLR